MDRAWGGDTEMKGVPRIVPVLTVVVLSLTSCQWSESRKDHVAGDWVAAWNSHDVERIVPIFTEDVLYEDVPFGAVNHGSAELRKFAAFFIGAVPDLRLELVSSSVDQRHGTIEWRLSGTDKGVYKTGKQFSVLGVSVIDVRHGRISRNLDYYDTAAIMRQVGVLPTEQLGSAK
jgi:steroid delta-isomerase-like uncharacterized protein